ncbi:hypothetical protein Poli38472_011889 [Pythium oligandrum]|uniref:Transmembrane protein n=1 Tax=Pythium oligandrum TaxID=41045 RepID=A0A8K1C8E1_PYTOL|nr:hypothetical protein Poli38472_011889 [Pythium oligandrum]|eukprot:TMW58301.1 hypothetical protein Poli38472_011889 [Pythium oligandrum]
MGAKTSKATTATPSPAREKPLRRVLLGLYGVLSTRALSLCWITYVLGILWVLLHPAVTVSTGELKPRGTYFSENALLVDSMEPKASNHDAFRVRQRHAAFLQLPQLPPTGCRDNCSYVLNWLESEMQAIDRVETYRQRFQAAPGGEWRTNLYGILRAAPFGDHKESVALVTHFRNVGLETNGGEYSGAALSLQLLAFLSDATWLAKDVILVFADDGELDGVDGYAPGTDAWLRAYHMDPLQDPVALSLPMRAGLIRAAINVETVGNVASANVVGIYTAGINGQLPNLDLVNTAVRHARFQGAPVVLDRCETMALGPEPCQDSLTRAKQLLLSEVVAKSQSQLREYVENLYGMLRFMKTLATGPSGPHASFISYNIDAITFAPAKASTSQYGGASRPIRNLLRSLELTVRSMSNIEEKLHQSFFLYVLPNTATFVSVGEYYYTVALVVSPAIANLLVLASHTAGMRVAFALTALFVVELLGAGVLGLLTRASSSVFVGILALVTAAQLGVALVLPRVVQADVFRGTSGASAWLKKTQEFDTRKPEDKWNVVDDSGWRALKSVFLALIVYAHCILGILNYPMALFCAIPVSFFAIVRPIREAATPLKRVWLVLWLAVSSPLAVFVVSSLIDANATSTALTSVIAGFVHRTNLLALPYLCGLYLPVHTLALAVALFPAESRSNKAKTH